MAERVHSNIGKVASITIAFYKTECDLWREGAAHYLTMLARTATNKLDDIGAIGPYEFQCIGNHDGHMIPFTFQARERG